jgi:hypothetical protein
MPTAEAIQWVEATTPKVPAMSGRVVNVTFRAPGPPARGRAASSACDVRARYGTGAGAQDGRGLPARALADLVARERAHERPGGGGAGAPERGVVHGLRASRENERGGEEKGGEVFQGGTFLRDPWGSV